MQKLKRLRLSLTCRVQSLLCWGSEVLGRGWRRSCPVTVPCLWRAIAPLQGEIKAWGVDELGAHLCWSPWGVRPVRRLWIFQVLLEIKGLGVSPRSAVRKHPCWQGLLNHAAPLHAFCCTLTNYTLEPAIQAVPGLWGVGSMVLGWFSSCEAGWLWWAPMVCPMRSSSCSCQDSAGSRNHTRGKAAPTWRAGNLTSSSCGCLVASGPWVAPGPSWVHAVALSQPISRSRYDYIALILWNTSTCMHVPVPCTNAWNGYKSLCIRCSQILGQNQYCSSITAHRGAFGGENSSKHVLEFWVVYWKMGFVMNEPINQMDDSCHLIINILQVLEFPQFRGDHPAWLASSGFKGWELFGTVRSLNS